MNFQKATSKAEARSKKATSKEKHANRRKK